jgi:hypothetical protein
MASQANVARSVEAASILRRSGAVCATARAKPASMEAAERPRAAPFVYVRYRTIERSDAPNSSWQPKVRPARSEASSFRQGAVGPQPPGQRSPPEPPGDFRANDSSGSAPSEPIPM